MRTLLLTGYDDAMKEIGDITSEVMARYATRHGFDFLRVRQYDSNLHPSWQKTEHVTRQIEAGYRRVLWLDADTLITNLAESFETFCGSTPLHVSQDWGSDATEEECFSMGNFLALADGRTLWRDLWVKHLPMFRDRYANKDLWEQSAMRDIYTDRLVDPKLYFKVHPRRTFNAVHASLAPSAPEPWQPGDWLCHLTGEEITNEKRMVVLKELLKEVVE